MGKGKRRYTTGYMIYGCDSCKLGFKMYLEESLENDKAQPRKPVPYVIKCPFCGKLECRDVSFKKIKLPRQRILPRMPAFVNMKGDPSGVSINLERAKPEFRKPDPAHQVTPEEMQANIKLLEQFSREPTKEDFEKELAGLQIHDKEECKKNETNS